MNAPIPEPTPIPGPIVRGPRPRWLGVLLALDLVIYVATFLVLRRDPKLLDPEFSAQTNLFIFLFVFFLFLAVWAGVAWALWCGHNWARIVALLFSVFSIAAYLVPDESANTYLTVFGIGVAVAWVYFLSRRATVDWCKGAA